MTLDLLLFVPLFAAVCVTKIVMGKEGVMREHVMGKEGVWMDSVIVEIAGIRNVMGSGRFVNAASI